MSSDAATLVPGAARLDGRARWMRSGDDWCVAHWHAAHAPARRVVILCASIGPEHLRGQRAYRVLADRLAARGVCTLRFDYPATGNSTGDAIGAGHSETDLVQRWCRSIVDAAAYARQIVPGADIVLVGRRLGALLAMEASRLMPDGATKCVLWDPPASGRSFVREMRLRESARLDQRYAEELSCEHPDILVQWEGHRFGRRTVEAIEQLSLGETGANTESVDVVATDPDRIMRSLSRSSLSHTKVRVAGHRAADAAFDWSIYEGTTLPLACLDVIEECAMEGAPLANGDDVLGEDHQPHSEVCHGTERAISEGLVRFGPARALFGVTTSPSSGAAPTTAALILPTGNEPSSGYGDMWARFARAAAHAGVPTLRIDWRGNGESLSHAGTPENVSYAPGRTDDVSEGIAWLRARFPDAAIVLVGLCSGGYSAVHAAAEGADADRVIAINPQLYWKAGMPTQLDRAALGPAVEMQLAEGLERALGDGRKWRRLMRGDYQWRDVARAVRGVAARRGWRMSFGRSEGDRLGGQLPRLDLEQLFPGPTRTHLVFSDDDFGLPHLQAHGRAAFGTLMGRAHMFLHVLEGCDHTFSRESMRAGLEPLLLEILTER